jgi:hypothetical protein
MLLLCLTFSNEKKVEIIFYTKNPKCTKSGGLCIVRDTQQKRTRVYAKKKKKRKKSLSS